MSNALATIIAVVIVLTSVIVSWTCGASMSRWYTPISRRYFITRHRHFVWGVIGIMLILNLLLLWAFGPFRTGGAILAATCTLVYIQSFAYTAKKARREEHPILE